MLSPSPNTPQDSLEAVVKEAQMQMQKNHRSAMQRREAEVADLRACFGKGHEGERMEALRMITIRRYQETIAEIIQDLRTAFKALTAMVLSKETEFRSELKTSLSLFMRLYSSCVLILNKNDESKDCPHYQSQLEELVAQLCLSHLPDATNRKISTEIPDTNSTRGSIPAARTEAVLTKLRLLCENIRSPPEPSISPIPAKVPEVIAVRISEPVTTSVVLKGPLKGSSPTKKYDADVQCVMSPTRSAGLCSYNPPALADNSPLPLDQDFLRARELDAKVANLMRKCGSTSSMAVPGWCPLASRAQQVALFMSEADGGTQNVESLTQLKETTAHAKRVQREAVLLRLRMIKERLQEENYITHVQELYHIKRQPRCFQQHIYCHMCGKGPFPCSRTFRCDACAARLVRLTGSKRVFPHNGAPANAKLADEARFEYFLKKSEERMQRRDIEIAEKKRSLTIEREGMYKTMIDVLHQRYSALRTLLHPSTLPHQTHSKNPTLLLLTNQSQSKGFVNLLRPVPGITTPLTAQNNWSGKDREAATAYRPAFVKNPLKRLAHLHAPRGPSKGSVVEQPPEASLAVTSSSLDANRPFILPEVIGSKRVPATCRIKNRVQ